MDSFLDVCSGNYLHKIWVGFFLRCGGNCLCRILERILFAIWRERPPQILEWILFEIRRDYGTSTKFWSGFFLRCGRNWRELPPQNFGADSFLDVAGTPSTEFWVGFFFRRELPPQNFGTDSF